MESPAHTQRKLAAIMFTDLVGFSQLSDQNEKKALELLEEHRKLLRAEFGKFNGTEVKTMGDGFLIEYPSSLDSVNCAISIQKSLDLNLCSFPKLSVSVYQAPACFTSL